MIYHSEIFWNIVSFTIEFDKWDFQHLHNILVVQRMIHWNNMKSLIFKMTKCLGVALFNHFASFCYWISHSFDHTVLFFQAIVNSNQSLKKVKSFMKRQSFCPKLLLYIYKFPNFPIFCSLMEILFLFFFSLFLGPFRRLVCLLFLNK